VLALHILSGSQPRGNRQRLRPTALPHGVIDAAHPLDTCARLGGCCDAERRTRAAGSGAACGGERNSGAAGPPEVRLALWVSFLHLHN